MAMKSSSYNNHISSKRPSNNKMSSQSPLFKSSTKDPAWISTLPSLLACSPRLEESDKQRHYSNNVMDDNTKQPMSDSSRRRRRGHHISSNMIYPSQHRHYHHLRNPRALQDISEKNVSIDEDSWANNSSIPLSERFRKAMMERPHSPSKSQRTHATSTTVSSGSVKQQRQQSIIRVRSRTSSSTNTSTSSSQRPPLLPPSVQRHHHPCAPPSLTVTASTSFSDSDVSFLSFHHDDDDHHSKIITNSYSLDVEDDQLTTASSILSEKERQQLQFYRRRASVCFDNYGIHHCQTANAFLELGLAHVRCEQYTAAQDFFRTALRVFEKKFGPKDLRVAKTWEALGIAQSRWNSSATAIANLSPTSAASAATSNKAGLLMGLQSFRKCFRIRFDVLGPTAIDTVEALNKIANNYMKLGMASSAKNDYMEVMTVRTAIMGATHPSVAVAAQSLGMAHLLNNQHEQAKAHFLQALNVFAVNGLGDHPMAERMREDVKTLGFDLTRVEI